MAEGIVRFELSYTGSRTEFHEIDFYDVSQALIGFQRSLALTTHLILNGEIITQAPSLKGANIYALPPQEGSWKWTAIIMFSGTAFYSLTTAPHDSVLGNLISSAYDYVISETLGFHVDYNKTLGQQYEEYEKSHSDAKPLSESKMDSLVEKCETAIKQIHRPIVESESAEEGLILSKIGGTTRGIAEPLSIETYEYLQHTIRSDESHTFSARISSYNMNTFKGRAYLADMLRPVPFVLTEGSRTKRDVRLITNSLALNAQDPSNPAAEILLNATSFMSRTGRLKWLLVHEVTSAT